MSVKKDPGRGTWFFVVDVAGLGGRRQQFKRRGFATKKAAEAAEAAVVAEEARGTFVRPSKVTVGAFLVDEWLPARRAGLKPSTAASYEQMITAYVVPTLGPVALGKVDGAMLNALYARPAGRGPHRGRRRPDTPPPSRRGLSPKSVRNVHGMLHRAFRDAIRWRRLPVNPCDAADPPRRATPEMHVWSSAELGRFLEATAGERAGAVWMLLATTGMRRGELLGLRWSDVDVDAKTVDGPSDAHDGR